MSALIRRPAGLLLVLLTTPLLHAADRLKSRPLPAARPDRVLAVGDRLATAAGETHCVRLPDRSVLFVRAGTTLTVQAADRIELSKGELFIETAPGKLAPTLSVRTPSRSLQASDSRFLVRASEAGTSVAVASGRVQVDGVAVRAGQLLGEKGEKPGRAPRISHLVAWTQAVRRAAPLVPASEHAGGTLIACEPDGQEAKLELHRYHVDVHVEDGFARTTIDVTYFNHSLDRLEGTFRFPLPPDASLSRLAMYVDGKLMEGGMAERDHARAAYETILWERRDPALLEWVDGSTFKMRVFPLEPRQEKRLLLSYSQRLPSLYGALTYRFPAGHSLGQVRRWSLHARVKAGAGMFWQSESHVLTPSKAGSDLLLDASQKDTRLDRDVVLQLTARKAPPVSFSATRQDGFNYLLVRYRPDLVGPAQPERRDWVVLVETSGDRDPLLARTQVELVRSLLSNTGRDDTFVLLTCATRATHLHPKAVRNDPPAVEEAMKALEEAHLVGAFDLGAALAAARPHLEAAKNPFLVHVGSGIPAMGQREPNKLLELLPKGARYVGVGVGRRWERALMQTLAEKTGGYFTQVNPDEDVAWRGLDLASLLDAPRLLDVSVSDPEGKATFLPFTRLVSQGEEVAAVARCRGEPPAKVRIRGSLGGHEFARDLEVRQVREQAAYLPRTWARLEIDRLLAQDALKNKPAIVALSKQMYVMTPFTSLLVLENDDMYTRFKVDRGRKDHWALYPAPAKVPVVVEPLDGDEGDPRKGIKPSARAVRQSILVRGLSWSQHAGNQHVSERRATQPVEKLLKEYNALFRDGKYSEAEALATRAHELDPDNGVATAAVFIARRQRAVGDFRDIKSRREETNRMGLNNAEDEGDPPVSSEDRWSMAGKRKAPAQPIGKRLDFSQASNAKFNPSIMQNAHITAGLLKPLASGGTAGVPFGTAYDQPSGRLGVPLLYSRPGYTGDDRLYYDLLGYAPGMNTTPADVRAVLEGEARPDARLRPGSIAPEVRALIERARRPAWRSLGVPAGGLSPAYRIHFDGAGKYAWERTLPSGLRETVVCDGKALWHLYPELGLAARRSASREHRLAFSAHVPNAVASADDLARGADLVLVDQRTVAIVPHRAKDAKKHLHLHLLFARDGTLAERRLVEVPARKVWRREICAKVEEAKAPSLLADVSKLVVLEMPYRTPEHVTRALGIEKKGHAELSFAQAMKLLAAFVAAGNAAQARDVFVNALARQEQRQIGYYVLLAAAGANLDSDNLDVLDAHPHEPLAHYLALHSSPVLRKHASRWAAASNVWGSGILRRLGLGHALCQRWASRKSLGTSVSQRRAERWRALAYLKQYPGNELAWVLLCLMQDRTAEEQDESERKVAYGELAKACELFADLAALGGLARYEQARCLWRAGQAGEARKQFTALYRAAREDGRLLRLDSDFRDALLEQGGWTELLRETAADLLAKKERSAVLTLARQSWQLDDQVMSRWLLSLALKDLPVKGKEGLDLYGAALDWLTQTEQRDEADRLIGLLLADTEHAKRPELWRRAAYLATQREQPARALACQERALTLEYASLPEVINLAQVRQDYRSLLSSYSDLTRAMATLKLPAPAGFRVRVVQAADRWRALDRQQDEACKLAAGVLRQLGEGDLAFDYLATPVGLRPGESDVWVALARDLVCCGERTLADRAYRSAFERESSNAQLLWDRAENLRQAGWLAQAQALYRQIADTPWQPRFASLKAQAQWLLDGK